MKWSSLRRALVVAGAYVTLAGLWILASGRMVASLASTAEELEQLERWKGIGFVLFTGTGLFFLAWAALRRQQQDAEEASRAREALLKSERNAMAGLFVSSISHDASNLAMVINATHELLGLDASLSPDNRQALGDAEAAMTKLVTLFRDLKQMGSGRDASTRVETDLVALVRRTAALLKGHSALKRCEVSFDTPPTLVASVFPVLIDQVLINLLLNAADATSGRGHLEVRLRAAGDEVRLEVHDDGKGVAPALQPHLFTPFATTKPHGTGLGLVSVRECARAHEGRVEYAPSPLGGAAFSVVLPTRPPPGRG